MKELKDFDGFIFDTKNNPNSKRIYAFAYKERIGSKQFVRIAVLKYNGIQNKVDNKYVWVSLHDVFDRILVKGRFMKDAIEYVNTKFSIKVYEFLNQEQLLDWAIILVKSPQLVN